MSTQQPEAQTAYCLCSCHVDGGWPQHMGCGECAHNHPADTRYAAPRQRLDLEQLRVETFAMGRFAHWGACHNPRCGQYDLLDADGCCHDCYYFPDTEQACDEGAPALEVL